MKLDEIYQVNGYEIIVRREDKRYKFPLPPHGKMGVVDLLCKYASARGYNMIGCFGSKTSNWIAGVPIIASKYGLKAVVCYPAKNLSSCPGWLQNSAKRQHLNIEPNYGYQLKLLHPNMTQINSSQARKYVEERQGFFIPFGFDLPICVEYLSKQYADMPKKIGTLVVSCGSGITLAGLLRAVRFNNIEVKRIEAVSSGRPVKSIIATISKHQQIPRNINWREVYTYSKVPNIECPWPAHGHYELKAYDWLVNYQAEGRRKLPEPIYFVNVGRDL